MAGRLLLGGTLLAVLLIGCGDADPTPGGSVDQEQRLVQVMRTERPGDVAAWSDAEIVSFGYAACQDMRIHLADTTARTDLLLAAVQTGWEHLGVNAALTICPELQIWQPTTVPPP